MRKKIVATHLTTGTHENMMQKPGRRSIRARGEYEYQFTPPLNDWEGFARAVEADGRSNYKKTLVALIRAFAVGFDPWDYLRKSGRS